MQKYPKNNSIERSIYNKKAFAAMNFPIFFAYRTKNTYLNIPGVSAYLLPLSQIIQ